MKLHRNDKADGHDGTELDERIEKIAREAIEEARMVLPGIQALFGFQLVAVFNQRFPQLPAIDQHLHLLALLLIVVAIAIIMTPAAYHRQAEPGTVSEFFVGLASRLITIAMVPLLIGLCIDVYVLGNVVLASRTAGIAIAVAFSFLFVALWFVFPLGMRYVRGRGTAGHDETACAARPSPPRGRTISTHANSLRRN